MRNLNKRALNLLQRVIAVFMIEDESYVSDLESILSSGTKNLNQE